MKIRGKLYLPGSSRSGIATLQWALGNYRLNSPLMQGEQVSASEGVTVNAPVGKLPHRFVFPDGSVFESGDPADAETLLHYAGQRLPGSWLGWLEQNRKTLLLGVCVLMLLAVGTVRYGLPLAGDQIARTIPDRWLQLAGTHALDVLDESVFAPSGLSEEQRLELTRHFHELAEAAKQTPPPVLAFRTSKMLGPNAITLPGGVVVLTDELVTLAEHPDEVAGVLAHELGHVRQRHPARRLVRSLLTVAVLALVLDDAASLAEELAAASGALLNLAYTREFEAEADAEAKRIMALTGRSVEPLVRMLDRLAQHCGEACTAAPEWFSTHPSFPARIETLRQP